MKSSFHNQIWPLILFAFGISAFIPTDLFAQVSADQKSAATAKPKRGYTISKETTYFTGPLKADGTIDFVAAINEHFSKGVTHENNAARIIVPLLDPSNWGQGNRRRDRMIEAMGLDADQYPPEAAFSEASYFRPEGNESALFLKEFNAGTAGPWTDHELPRLAKFLSDNSAALDKISAATRKDRYFVPLLVDGESDSLVSILLEHVQGTRSVARAFAIRVNNHLGNGRSKEAWDDILAIKRLGQLVAQGPTLIDGLVGVAITGIACQSATKFINEADSNAIDWLELQEAWETRPIADIGAAIGNTERTMFIQMVCNMGDHANDLAVIPQWMPGTSEFSEVLPNKLLAKTLQDMLTSGEVKIDDVLRYANKTYDYAIEISNLPSACEREATSDYLESELSVWPKDDRQSLLVQVFFAKPKEPARQFTDVLLGLVFPTVRTVNYAERRTEASQHVIKLALTARALQSRTGHLPESILELEPFVDESILSQPSVDAEIALRSDPSGLLIYHWCANRVDNGGDIDGDRPTDWGIRIAK